MEILILGGTGWLGGEIVRQGLAAGHALTCLARGRFGEPPTGAHWVQADRDAPGAYDATPSGLFDLVVDLATHPGHSRSAAEALKTRCGHWVYVSSASVYSDDQTCGQDEAGPTHEPLEADRLTEMERYGAAKRACELHAERVLGPQRVASLRAGLIGGPGDASGRTGYWPRRFAQHAAGNGQVLVPDSAALLTQVIDVRDLAAFVLTIGANRTAGPINVMGQPTALPDHLDAAASVAGHTGPRIPASPEWLLAQGVNPWMGPRSLPVWLPLPEYAGFGSRDTSRAASAGLHRRPLRDTLAETLAWELEQPQFPHGAGLTDAEERELLSQLTQP